MARSSPMSAEYEQGCTQFVSDGFEGFVSIETLCASDVAAVPSGPGVYVVLRQRIEPPEFSVQGPGTIEDDP